MLCLEFVWHNNCKTTNSKFEETLAKLSKLADTIFFKPVPPYGLDDAWIGLRTFYTVSLIIFICTVEIYTDDAQFMLSMSL